MAAKKRGATRSARRPAARKPATRRFRRRAGSARSRSAAALAPGAVFVINMIPRSLSGETQQDSEPHLTVNPANPQQIVGTAFTPDPAGGSNAPIYVSQDGGQSWNLNSIVPSVSGSIGTGDITTGFSGKNTTLYAGILNAGSFDLQFLRTKNPFLPNMMTILLDRPDADQPYLHARKKGTKELVYVGENDTSQRLPIGNGKTATVDQSRDAGKPTPVFTSPRVEKRTTLGQNGPQTRPTSHADGTVYASFYRWRAASGNFQANTLVVTSADVVVVRDDHFGSGANPYTALVDPGDGTAGVRVVQGVSFPFMVAGNASTGQQRLGGSISIAVDPANSSTVYLAWGDRQANSVLTLHVRVSRDRGATWSNDLLVVSNATNAALAVNDAGIVGFLYQQIRGTGASQRWQTHFRRSADGVNWTDLVLCDTPSMSPLKSFDPYIGDYDHVVAAGAAFCGIFAANNTPDHGNFPNGVVYQRNADFNGRRLLAADGSTVVAPSIDPFFFRVT